jgi:hypothetical protein
MIKDGKFNTREVAGRPFVVNDAQFRSMPIKHKVAPSILKEQVQEIKSGLTEALERIAKLEQENKELRAWIDAFQRRKDKRDTSKYKEKWPPPLAMEKD